MPKNEGPTVTVKYSCYDCKYCVGESYTCQGDSGTYVSCMHPNKPEKNQIGVSSWNTPGWCPVMTQFKTELFQMLD